jgi:hypothetical protein
MDDSIRPTAPEVSGNGLHVAAETADARSGVTLAPATAWPSPTSSAASPAAVTPRSSRVSAEFRRPARERVTPRGRRPTGRRTAASRPVPGPSGSRRADPRCRQSARERIRSHRPRRASEPPAWVGIPIHHPDPGRPTAPEAASTFWSADQGDAKPRAPLGERTTRARGVPGVKPVAASVRAPCSYPPGTDLCAAGQTIPHPVPGSASICGVLHTGRPPARRRQFRRAAAETLVHCRLLVPHASKAGFRRRPDRRGAEPAARSPEPGRPSPYGRSATRTSAAHPPRTEWRTSFTVQPIPHRVKN